MNHIFGPIVFPGNVLILLIEGLQFLAGRQAPVRKTGKGILIEFFQESLCVLPVDPNLFFLIDINLLPHQSLFQVRNGPVFIILESRIIRRLQWRFFRGERKNLATKNLIGATVVRISQCRTWPTHCQQ